MKKLMIALFLLAVATVGTYASSDTFWYKHKGPTTGPVYSILVSDQFILAGVNGNVFKSLDKGKTWNASNTGLGETSIYSLKAGSNGSIYAGSLGLIYKSIDDGASWMPVNSALSNYTVSTIGVNSKGWVYAGISGNLKAGDGGVYRSVSQGASWEQVVNGLTSLQVTVIAINKNDYIYAGAIGGLYVSKDDGNNWTKIHTIKTSENVTGIVFDSSGHIYVSYSASGIYKSVNIGKTWTLITKGLEARTISSLYCAENNYLWCGVTDIGPFMSSDTGASWVKKNMGMPDVINIQKYAENKVGDMFSATGSGFWSTIPQPKDTVPEDTTDYIREINYVRNMQVIPNPIVNSAMLVIESDKECRVSIEIINELGLPVSIIQKDYYLLSGRNEVPFELPALASGMYFIRIFDGKDAIIKKIVISK